MKGAILLLLGIILTIAGCVSQTQPQTQFVCADGSVVNSPGACSANAATGCSHNNPPCISGYACVNDACIKNEEAQTGPAIPQASSTDKITQQTRLVQSYALDLQTDMDLMKRKGTLYDVNTSQGCSDYYKDFSAGVTAINRTTSSFIEEYANLAEMLNETSICQANLTTVRNIYATDWAETQEISLFFIKTGCAYEMGERATVFENQFGYSLSDWMFTLSQRDSMITANLKACPRTYESVDGTSSE